MLRTAFFFAALSALVACAVNRPDPPVREVATASDVDSRSPDATYQLLKEGNLRFVSRTLTPRDWKAQLERSADEIHPTAAVLTTPDPRLPFPLVFDLGIGDLLVIRTPGPVVSPAVARGLEHFVHDDKIKVIVVLTHSDSQCVELACAGMTDPYLESVVSAIQPAMDATPRESDGRIIQGMSYEDAVAAEHAIQIADRLRSESVNLAEAEREGLVKIVAGYYDVPTGAVVWL